MSKQNTPAPTLREQFLAAQAAKPATVSAQDWPAYALANAGDEVPVLIQSTPVGPPAEVALVYQLNTLLEATGGLKELREVALLARALFPAESFQVGAGSSHVWIVRVRDAEGRGGEVARIFPGSQVHGPRDDE